MKGKRKRLTNSQSELVATYLPKKIQKDRKIPTSVKLVLANIYQLHYLQKNLGKRTVFRERDEFIKDIEANDKNEVVRPQAYLMANDMVYINPGVRGRATEYTLNDELYELLPSMFKGELSDNFMKFKEDNQLNIKQLETENQEVIVPSHNSMIDSELQHLNVPSDSDTDSDTHEYNISSNKDINKTILHDKPETVLHELDTVDELSVEGNAKLDKNKTIPPDINGYQFWKTPVWYVMELTSFKHDDSWCALKDFIKQGYYKDVVEAISQLDDKTLADALNEDIDNCIQRLQCA